MQRGESLNNYLRTAKPVFGLPSQEECPDIYCTGTYDSLRILGSDFSSTAFVAESIAQGVVDLAAFAAPPCPECGGAQICMRRDPQQDGPHEVELVAELSEREDP